MSSVPGLDARLDEIQAAVLRIKLRFLDQANMARRGAAALRRVAGGAGLVLPGGGRTGSVITCMS